MDYVHVAYFNGADAINLMNCTADEIVNDMKNGIGCCYTTGDAYVEDEDYFTINFDGHYTKDKKYIVVYDVALRWEGKDVSKVDETELMDEYIDIYKKLE